MGNSAIPDAFAVWIIPTSLSQAVRKLEEHLGTALFNRTTSGLTLTYAGERYYHMATQILKMYENFEIEISNMNNLKTGRIHLGITNHLGILILPQTVNHFRKICPFVDITVTEDNTDSLKKRLLTGELGLYCHACSCTKPQYHKISYETLQRNPFVLVMVPGHPLAKEARMTDGYPYPVLDIRLLDNEPMIRLHSGQRIGITMVPLLFSIDNRYEAR